MLIPEKVSTTFPFMSEAVISTVEHPAPRCVHFATHSTSEMQVHSVPMLVNSRNDAVGVDVGLAVGAALGSVDGAELGDGVGPAEGAALGVLEGAALGVVVGPAEGAEPAWTLMF